MTRIAFRYLATLAATLTILSAVPAPASAQVETAVQNRPVIRRAVPPAWRNRALQFIRTELFFGTAKPDGAVTEEEFMTFLDAEVTPRFPAGLTLMKAQGQFTGEDGVLIKEDSYILVLLYPIDSFRDGNKQIETIRKLYLEQFQQESVLRVDDPFAVRVSF